MDFEALLLKDIFPDQYSFDSSTWSDWEKRIKLGQEKEDNAIEKKAEHWKAPEGSEKWPFDPSEWINDAYWQTTRLTNSMYASLIVTLWSDMEHFLTTLVKTCKLKDAWKFGEIKKRFKDKLKIDIEMLKSYSIINAIHILNNSFKHTDGYYKPDISKQHTQIHQALLDQWNFGS